MVIQYTDKKVLVLKICELFLDGVKAISKTDIKDNLSISYRYKNGKVSYDAETNQEESTGYVALVRPKKILFINTEKVEKIYLKFTYGGYYGKDLNIDVYEKNILSIVTDAAKKIKETYPRDISGVNITKHF